MLTASSEQLCMHNPQLLLSVFTVQKEFISSSFQISLLLMGNPCCFHLSFLYCSPPCWWGLGSIAVDFAVSLPAMGCQALRSNTTAFPHFPPFALTAATPCSFCLVHGGDKVLNFCWKLACWRRSEVCSEVKEQAVSQGVSQKFPSGTMPISFPSNFWAGSVSC